MPSIYDLTEQYQQLYDLLLDGDIDEQTVIDNLDAIDFDGQFEDKADGYAKVIRQLDHDAAAAEAESARLTKRKRSFERRAEQLKERLCIAMKLVGKEKFKTPFASYRIQTDQPKTIIDDIGRLRNDVQWWKARKWDESEIDKTKIKEAITSGVEVPGAHLERGESLRIR